VKIKLADGGGGKETAVLIENIILKHLGNEVLGRLEDGAVLPGQDSVVFTTDSYVVKPLFFPGGDIGKLAVCGTLNDLAVMGAVPEHLSLALIIEERIVESIAAECVRERVRVVCGDTKVVEKGSGDGLFINTSGIGRLRPGVSLSASGMRPGDSILLNGPVGQHGAAILGARKELGFSAGIESDCAALTSLISAVFDCGGGVRAMRDATRGGLAAVVNELGRLSGVTVCIDEAKVPIPDQVQAACGLLGLSPFELANEGRVVAAVDPGRAEEILSAMRGHPLGRQAEIIGRVEEKGPFPAVLKTRLGARIVLEMPRGEHLPRIC
jgi:hydrogenase expression/formation protein HypE